tara:strand:+ start:257 stop:1153 length:897 start_codon:yes stop_codon:yes gene_type:complete
MKILITGASGFIGLSVVKSLLKEGYKVMALSRKTPEKNSSIDINWIEADLSKIETYREKIITFAPDIVIYLAWQDIPDFSFETSQKNLNHAINFFSIILAMGCCKKILVSGSDKELNLPKGVCFESDKGDPNNGFSWSKHAIRSWLEINCNRNSISLGWLRIFFCYGPRQRSSSLLPSLLKHLPLDRLPDINNPRNANDYVYVEDVADAFLKAISKNFPSGIFNIGSGSSTTVLKMCKLAEQIVRGSEDLSNKLQKESKNTESAINFWADFSRSKKYLGWEPTTNLTDGINKTWNQLR